MNKIKLVCIGFGSVFAFAHLGLVGHLMRLSSNQLPIINLPVGDYTSYTIEAGKEGYRIQYNSNDPKVMGVTKHIDCLLYTSPSPRDGLLSRMPSSA